MAFSLGIAHAAEFSVSNFGDSGAGTLRDAIAQAQNSTEDDTITFTASGVITLRSSLGTFSSIGGALTIRNTQASGVTISGNNQVRIFGADGGAKVTLDRLTITGGKSGDVDDGGAIISNNSAITITNCTLSGNSTGNRGGAIDNGGGGTLTIINSTLSNNSVVNGGGGGAINNGNATLTIINSTLTGNSVDSEGGAINAGGTVIIQNSIVAGNFSNLGPDNISGPFVDNGNNLLFGDPKLGPLTHNGGPTHTHLPLAGSPAIDAGQSAEAFDQRGVARPFGPADDIGAIEVATEPSGDAALVVTTTQDIFLDDGRVSLREAINSANNETLFPGANTITFALAGQGPHIIDLGDRLPLLRGQITIDNSGAPVTLNRLNGGRNAGILQTVQGVTARVVGLTLRGGVYAGGSGGGAIQNNSSSNFTVERCNFVNNVGSFGGAIFNASGTMTIIDSTFSQNNAIAGAAIYNSGPLTMKGCTLSGNSGRNGAGFYNDTNAEVQVNIRNSTFSSNQALDNDVSVGGGLLNFRGTVNLESCTFTGNSASGLGAGILSSSDISSTRVRNCIIAGNAQTDVDINGSGANPFISDGFNLIGDGQATGAFANSSDQIIGDASPGLGALASNGGPTQTHALGANSPAIDAGDTSEAFEQRGVARPQSSDVTNRDDIGAFESTDPSGAAGLVVTTTADTLANDGLISLREAIGAANDNAGEDTITFDANVFVAPRKTIALTFRPQVLVGRQSAAAAPTIGSPLPLITGVLNITGPINGVTVAGRVGPNNALLSVGSGARASSTKLFFSGSKTGVRNAGTFNLTDGGFTSSTTNLLNTGTATLTRCTVQSSSQGIQNSGMLTVETSRFTGSTNGLVNVAGATATVRSSTFEGNAVGATNSGTMTLSNSTLSQNGDGMRNQNGNVTVIQSTLVGNTNAILNSGGASLRLLRATVTGNGDGLRTSGDGSVELRSTLLVSNGSNLIGTPTSGGSNLTGVTAQVAGLETDGNGFPLLKPNGGPTATVALLSGSMAIDKGEAGIRSGTDQRGAEFARVVGARVDVGAFEFQSASANAPLRDAAPSGGSS